VYDDVVGIRWKWRTLDSVSVNAPSGGNDWLTPLCPVAMNKNLEFAYP
jgi:hypothetical protein